MSRRASLNPTEAELEILSVLWRQGPSTVREIHDILQLERSTTLTTTLKILQLMTEKGLTHQDEGRPHRFTAVIAEEKTQAGLVKDLVKRAFDGSVRKLLVRAVEVGGMSAKELRDIQQLIDQVQKGKGKTK